jgi:pyruvate/2-oxoglutarate/acetoin dehydrogenase E1 component
VATVQLEVGLHYKDELTRAMDYLAEDPRVVFIGNQVAVKGNSMTTTLVNIPDERKIELPVSEELQMGMSLGMALDGHIPVTFYPRFNFLLCAVNQLVNHLDKMKEMSSGGYQPKVIIRTAVGSERPLNPQCQHIGDFTEAFRAMCSNIEVIRLDEPDDIFPAYRKALTRRDGKSTLVVEWGDHYLDK